MTRDSKTAPVLGKNRLPYIDLLECIALFFMLMYHCTLYSAHITPDSLPVHYVNYFCSTIQATCVPLFFFVNGYLLFGKPLNLSRHTKKILRLALVSAFWILALLIILQPLQGEFFTWEQLKKEFWSLKMGWNNHLWFMGTLVGLYVFFPLLKTVYDSNKTVFLWFTAVSFVLVYGNSLLNVFLTVFNYVVMHQVVIYQSHNFFHIFNPYAGTMLGFPMVCFCTGGIVYHYRERIAAIPAKRRNLAASVGLVLSCGLLFCQGVGYSILAKFTWDAVWFGLDTIFTFINVLCLYLLSLNWKWDIPVIRMVSLNTLGIYLLHDAVMKIVGPYFSAIPQMHTVPGTALYALTVLSVCLIVCLVVKRIPVLKHLL